LGYVPANFEISFGVGPLVEVSEFFRKSYPNGPPTWFSPEWQPGPPFILGFGGWFSAKMFMDKKERFHAYFRHGHAAFRYQYADPGWRYREFTLQEFYMLSSMGAGYDIIANKSHTLTLHSGAIHRWAKQSFVSFGPDLEPFYFKDVVHYHDGGMEHGLAYQYHINQHVRLGASMVFYWLLGFPVEAVWITPQIAYRF
jgi:hypothetical protein